MARPVTLYNPPVGRFITGNSLSKSERIRIRRCGIGTSRSCGCPTYGYGLYQGIKDLLKKYDLRLYAISTHLVGQVCLR